MYQAFLGTRTVLIMKAVGDDKGARRFARGSDRAAFTWCLIFGIDAFGCFWQGLYICIYQALIMLMRLKGKGSLFLGFGLPRG